MVKGDPVQCIEVFRKSCTLIGFAIAISVFEDDQFIFRGQTGDRVGKGRHGDHP